MWQLLCGIGTLAFVFLLLQPELSQYAFAASITGIMVPLYTYPGDTWNQVIATKNAHPTVPIIAVINPQNGSGNAQDPNYVTGIQNLQAAGVIVLGYVHTNYANRDLNSAINDTNNYKNWYNVNGIFFDEMSNEAANVDYYSDLNNHSKSIGFSFTVGNSGVDTLPDYVGVMDTIVVHDNSGLPSLSFLGGWHTNYDKNNFSSLSYDVQTYDTTFTKKISNYVGYVYISNGTAPNPWNSLSPYFDDMVNSIENDVAVSVNSASNSGTALSGLWTELSSGNILVKTGFTPRSYSLVSGLEYLVCVGDYENYLFDHWDDNGTQRCRTLTPTQNVNLTAYYQTEITVPPNPITITIQSVNNIGDVITGLWTTLYSNSVLVKSGFSTLSYTANADAQYDVCMYSYQNYVFEHWEDANVNNCRSIIPTQNVTLTASYDVQSVLTVDSVDKNGNVISGMWTEIYSDASLLETGFTPQSYLLKSDLQYLICVSDYQNYTFSHWENGEISRCRTINGLPPNLIITGYYDN